MNVLESKNLDEVKLLPLHLLGSMQTAELLPVL